MYRVVVFSGVEREGRPCVEEERYEIPYRDTSSICIVQGSFLDYGLLGLDEFGGQTVPFSTPAS